MHFIAAACDHEQVRHYLGTGLLYSLIPSLILWALILKGLQWFAA